MQEYNYEYDLYDYDLAERSIDFIEAVCYVPEGAHARRKLVLRPWQKELILDVYRESLTEGYRVTRHATLSIGRKNGKTALIAALMICHLCGPLAVPNGEISSFALTRDQASMLFRYAAGMVRLNHRLLDRLNIVDSKKHITYPGNGSHYTALSADARTQLGRSPTVAFGDELGAFRQDRALYDSLMTGQGAHENPLMWVLSTQAPNDTDLLSELIDYTDTNPDDLTYYCKNYTLDPDDDPWLEKNWYKANPALGDFLHLRDFRSMAEKAKLMPGSQGAFLNLRLNLRIDAADAFMSKDAWWDNLHDRMPTFEDLRGKDVSLGIDIAMRRDLSAMVFTALKDDSEDIIVVPAFFMPKGSLRERQEEDKINYPKWVTEGYLIAPPGNSIDFDWVAKWMIKTVEDFELNVVSGGFDTYKFPHLEKALEDAGADVMFDEVEKFRQGFISMSPAVDLLEATVYEDRLWHGNHPVLTWNIANCVVVSDPASNRKLDKSKSFGKIDGAIALAMSLKTMDLEGDRSYMDEEDAEILFV